MHALRLQRPDHANLEYAQANRAGQLVDTQVFQRLPYVEVRLCRPP